MKKIGILLLFVLLNNQLFAQQQEEAKKLIGEGVTLHDKGDFAGAIALYDKALELDKDNVLALSEKALSLLSAKKFNESIVICKYTLDKYRGKAMLNSLYVTYGNALDDTNQFDESIKIYDEGIKQFPDSYMLYFNKAITLTKVKRYDEAMANCEKSVTLNPFHAGTHSLIGNIQREVNHNIPSLMAFARFLTLELQGPRAADNLAKLLEIMSAHVEKAGENKITVKINPALLDTKAGGAKAGADNFASTELLLSMNAAMDLDSKNAGKPKVELFIRKFDNLCASLKEGQASNSGFFWEYYAPFFIDMHQQKLVETFGYIAFIPLKDENAMNWLKAHPKEIDQFVAWNKDFNWKSNK